MDINVSLAEYKASKDMGGHPRNKRHASMQYAPALTFVKACLKLSGTPDSGMGSKHRMRENLDSNHCLDSRQNALDNLEHWLRYNFLSTCLPAPWTAL